jgi:hypothetical protein
VLYEGWSDNCNSCVGKEVKGKSFTVQNTTEDMAMSGSEGLTRDTHWVVEWAEYSTTAHQAVRLRILVRINDILFRRILL